MKSFVLMIASVLSVFAAPVMAAPYDVKPESYDEMFTWADEKCDIKCQIAELEAYLGEVQTEIIMLKLQMLKEDLAEVEGDQLEQKPTKPYNWNK